MKEHKCDDFVMNPDLVAKLATDEMAYVYIANYVLDLSAGVLNSEDVLTPFQDDQLVRHSQKAFELSCNIIINNHDQFNLGDLITKALQYCQDARSRPAPMGKDQN